MNITDFIKKLQEIEQEHGEVKLVQFHEDICFFNEKIDEWESILE